MDAPETPSRCAEKTDKEGRAKDDARLQRLRAGYRRWHAGVYGDGDAEHDLSDEERRALGRQVGEALKGFL